MAEEETRQQTLLMDKIRQLQEILASGRARGDAGIGLDGLKKGNYVNARVVTNKELQNLRLEFKLYPDVDFNEKQAQPFSIEPTDIVVEEQTYKNSRPDSNYPPRLRIIRATSPGGTVFTSEGGRLAPRESIGTPAEFDNTRKIIPLSPEEGKVVLEGLCAAFKS
jgi:hypothetical protein